MNKFLLLSFAAASALLVSCEKKEAPPAVEPKQESEPAAPVRKTEKPKPTGRIIQFGTTKIHSSEESEEEQQKPVEIRRDDSNIQKLNRVQGMSLLPKIKASHRDNWNGVTPVPAGSMAAAFDPPESIMLKWSPAWRDEGTGGVLLPEVQISPDKSLILFAETTGSAGDAAGTRLILLDVHRWEILKILELDRDVTAGRFIPGTMNFVCVCQEQKTMFQKRGLAIFSLKNGKELKFIPIPDSAGSRMAVSGQVVILNDDESPVLHVYSINAPDRKPMQIKLPTPGAIPEIMPGGKLAAAAVGHKIIVYKLSDGRALRTCALPDDFVLKQLYPADSEGRRFYAASDPNKNTPPLFIDGDRILTLPGASAGLLAFRKTTEPVPEILSAIRGKARIALLPSDSLQISDTITPSDLQPRTEHAQLRSIFPLEHISALAVMDEKGHFYLLRKPKDSKRWLKLPILNPVH